MSKKKKPFEEEILADIPEKLQETHKVTFAAWFEKAKKRFRLRDHQDYAVQVFFEKQGLTDKETPEKYDEYFKRF